jgi:hypothetical protein
MTDGRPVRKDPLFQFLALVLGLSGPFWLAGCSGRYSSPAPACREHPAVIDAEAREIPAD